PLSHGLGDRATASETVHRLTGERLDSLWTMWLDQTTRHITQPEAAEAATGALRAFLAREAQSSPVDPCIATRGSAPPPRRFTVDGTRLLGGARRPGDAEAWARFAGALSSVQHHLRAVSGGGPIRIHLACHLTAALATGRVFHQATGW